MNPIQINCPGCQKLFMVRQEDLTTGEQRFQCTACQIYFGFSWPQPPDVQHVRTFKFEIQKFQQANPPAAAQTVDTAQSKVTRTCINCGEKVNITLTECPQCGVVFDKVKKLKSSPEPVMPASGPEVVAAWEAVKANYIDERRHESFVQLCLSRESLPYASSQYRAILLVNPTDDIAKRMQNRIVDLATTAYITAQAQDRSSQTPRSRSLSSVALLVAFICVGLGFGITVLRPLVAVGVAILAFVFVLRAMNSRQE